MKPSKAHSGAVYQRHPQSARGICILQLHWRDDPVGTTVESAVMGFAVAPAASGSATTMVLPSSSNPPPPPPRSPAWIHTFKVFVADVMTIHDFTVTVERTPTRSSAGDQPWKSTSLRRTTRAPRGCGQSEHPPWVDVTGDANPSPYTRSNQRLDSTKDITLHDHNGNWTGIWSDGIAAWVCGLGSRSVFVCMLAAGTHVSARSLPTPMSPQHTVPSLDLSTVACWRRTAVAIAGARPTRLSETAHRTTVVRVGPGSKQDFAAAEVLPVEVQEPEGRTAKPRASASALRSNGQKNPRVRPTTRCVIALLSCREYPVSRFGWLLCRMPVAPAMTQDPVGDLLV